MYLIKVAVDASRVRSGGGVAHLLGILSIEDPKEFGIEQIHVWAYKKLLDQLPDRAWLIKHHPEALEKSLLHQSLWQGMRLSHEIKQTGCNILFSTDASTFCRFKPMVVLNQNMLAYDPGVLALFGWGKDRFQQTLMYFVQKKAFRFATASIFLTQHAAKQVQQRVGSLTRTVCIPHGVAEVFKQTSARAQWPTKGERRIQCLYVSPVFEYKHQNEVVLAVKRLRDQGLDIELTLAGGGGQRALKILDQLLMQVDPQRDFVKLIEFIPNNNVASLIAEADLFVFASSCETFGIALLEAMTIGVPIACSNRSSLFETLQDGGEYFDPQDPESIAKAIDNLVCDPARRVRLASRAMTLAKNYSWRRCAQETWSFISQTHSITSARVGS
ncbi:MAG: glycosyltransferase family 4 protein [Candidatus Methylopumilus sp.]|nr:glycosyltransferase family 4 protein [Candidatus Methylopumilus sp.]